MRGVQVDAVSADEIVIQEAAVGGMQKLKEIRMKL